MNILAVVSGGDAPGINMLLWRMAALATARGDGFFGAVGGLPGLMASRIVALHPPDLMPLAGMAGVYLQTSREPVLAQPGAEDRLRVVLKDYSIDRVLLFGGDGTLRHVLPLFAAWGVSCVGIPTTIDNDVPGTDYTLGHDSACNYAYHAIDGARMTAHALPGRIFMIETLGGQTGYIALEVAHGAGAHAVLVPEYDYDVEWLGTRLREAAACEGHALLVISEGIPAARTLIDDLPKWTGIRLRDVRLGHAQRGATPTHKDRQMAGLFAETAYTAFRDDTSGVVVVRAGAVMLHVGMLPEGRKASPDRARYDAINGL